MLPIRRLHAEQIARHELASPGEVVAWLGAVQAQDLGAAKWALGLRLPGGATEADIERALAEGVIVRTHALRSTWQLVHASDVRWMLTLVAPRLVKRLADGLAELARRYFRSRGPATVADFAWWSGLPMAEARAGLESAEPTLSSDVIGGQVHWAAGGRVPRRSSSAAVLLPAFDEYLVAYRNRDAVLAPGLARRLEVRGGMLAPCLVIDGVVRGTWRRVWKGRDAVIELDLPEPIPQAHAAIEKAAARYGAFLGLDARAIEVTETRRGRSVGPRRPG